MIFFFQAEDGIRDGHVTGVQTCALPISDVETALADGRAMDTWRAMITAQGGDVDAPLPEARHVEQVRAESDGVRSEERRVGKECGSGWSMLRAGYRDVRNMSTNDLVRHS